MVTYYFVPITNLRCMIKYFFFVQHFFHPLITCYSLWSNIYNLTCIIQYFLFVHHLLHLLFTYCSQLLWSHTYNLACMIQYVFVFILLLSTPLHQRAASRVQHPNHVAANSLSPQVARKGSTLSGFVQRSRLEREVARDLHSNKWEEV